MQLNAIKLAQNLVALKPSQIYMLIALPINIQFNLKSLLPQFFFLNSKKDFKNKARFKVVLLKAIKILVIKSVM